MPNKSWEEVTELPILTAESGEQVILIRPVGAVSPSETVGGAVNLDNSQSTGAGVVIYSNRGADALGRLLMVKDNNVANPQTALRVEKAGAGFALAVEQAGVSGVSAGAIDVVSVNPDCSSAGIEGRESGKGTLKITHTKPAAADPNASCISLSIEGAGTAAQGIFVDSPANTTGKLLNIRNNGADRFVVTAAGEAQTQDLRHQGTNLGVFGTVPTTKKTVTGSRGANAALASLLTQLAAYGLIIDSST